ncbi:helix-turn-helix domain-containing protein [Thauera aromatica]|nr:RodZ domain-containing protein [Thauera aromatica]
MQSENLPAAAGEPAVPSPGAQLRRAREARGESVSEVAFALKLSPRQIDALERDDFAALPGTAFVRGFLRNYARYLGLDAAPLLDGVQHLAGSAAPDLSPIRNADGDLPSRSGRRRGAFPAGMLVLALMLLVAAGWYFDGFRTDLPGLADNGSMESVPAENAPAESAPVAVLPLERGDAGPGAGAVAPGADNPLQPEVAASTPAATAAEIPAKAETPAAVDGRVAPAPAAQVPATEVPAAPPAPVAEDGRSAAASPPPAAPQAGSGGRLVLRFGADSWVEVRDAAGAILHSGLNRAGSVRTVQGKPPFALVVGNAAGVAVEFDGRTVDLAAHARGSVARLTLGE